MHVVSIEAVLYCICEFKELPYVISTLTLAMNSSATFIAFYVERLEMIGTLSQTQSRIAIQRHLISPCLVRWKAEMILPTARETLSGLFGDIYQTSPDDS
jgi:hypothetical protein